ncbi:unnamed protein product, partial [Medioppia subpectinata]
MVLFNLILYVILPAIFVIYWIYRQYTRNFNYWAERGIKGPPPIIGFGNVLTRFIWEKTDVEVAWMAKYGKLYGLYDGNIPVLSVAEPKLIKDILVKDFHVFDDRTANRFSHPLLSKDLNVAVGEDWKRQRSVISPVFTTGKMKQMFPLIEECVRELLDAMKPYVNTGREINMKALYGNYTMDVISRCAFGAKVNAQTQPDNPVVKMAGKPFNPKLYRYLALMVLPKWLLELFRATHNAEEDCVKFFVDLIRHIIAERRESGVKSNDLIDLLLTAANNKTGADDEHVVNDESHYINQGADELNRERQLFSSVATNRHMSEDEVLSNCWLFFVAGYESTANTLSFATHELALNPDKQRILYEEVCARVGPDGQFNYQSLTTEMPYLDACIAETLRLHAPAVRLWRYANRDYELVGTGITIKKGHRIEIPNHALHHCPEYFPEPLAFKPERFMPENRHKIVPYSYTPFGGGPRHCVGMRFAMMEAKLALATIMLNYKFITTPNTDIPVAIYRHYTRNFNYWAERGIKGPPPIIGFGNVLTRFIWEKTDVEVAWMAKYGKLYGIYDGNIPVLSVAEPQLIKQILVNDFHVFDDRTANRFKHSLLSKDLLFANGEDWKRQRSVISPVFTTGKMKQMLPLIEECVRELLDAMKPYASVGRAVNMKTLYGYYSMDVISRCAFGFKVNAQTLPDNPVVKMAAKQFRPKRYRFLALMVLPKWLLELFSAKHSTEEEDIQFFMDLIRHIIAERRESGVKSNDLIDLLLTAAKNKSQITGSSDGEPDVDSESHHINQGADELNRERQLFSSVATNRHMSEDEVLSNCWLFFVGGYESTTNTLSFATHELALNPDKQHILYEEVCARVGPNGQFDYQSLTTEMPYLDACIAETLRLHPPAVRLCRFANRDYELVGTGITIKRGHRIEIPDHALHLSPEYFPEPLAFKPERFMPENRHKIVPYSYTPFGGGPRHCVGMRFAMMETKLALATIMLNYKFITTPNTDIPVALDCSSSSGIGAAIVIKLWSLGANVVITGRDDKRIQQVVNKCQNRDNQRALGVRTDLLVDKDIEELVAKTIKEFGKIDILVNNAGICTTGRFGKPGYLESFDNTMNTNVRSIQVLTQLVVPYLEITKGNIVNISSFHSEVPDWRAMSYCMAKSALDMFTKCLALQLEPKGIRVNSVNPAVIRTALFDTATGDNKLLKHYESYCREWYPLGRMGEPEDVSEAVAFLCSPITASFITGLIMFVDGGALRASRSSSGIGEGIAIKLWSLGANVVITGRDDKRIQQVVDKCQNWDNQRALGVKTDLLVDKDIEELVAKTITEFGKIDILVNNAGIGTFVQFCDQNYMKAFDLVFNTNVRSIQVLTQLVVPYLKITKGNIINISSVASLKPSAKYLPYHMAKSALDMFTKCLALALGPDGIRVNCVSPAAIRTPIFEILTGNADALAAIEEHCRQNYPLGRVGEPEEVAAAVVYLCSPAAAFITGAILTVDGGYTRASRSSSGIGEGIAIKLWSLGANVVITGRDDKRIQQVVDKCHKRDNQRALGVKTDLLVDKDIEELVAKTITEFGKIDILVNNAGVGTCAQFCDQNYMKDFDLVFNTNVRSIQVLTQLVVPYLKITKGNIVNISSIAGLKPSAKILPYHMAKSALDMFTKCLALALGPDGVRINCVSPAAIRTPIFEIFTGNADALAAIEEHCRRNYPLGRIGEPKDVASAVAYLCSPAASFITGAILPVDGGYIRASCDLQNTKLTMVWENLHYVPLAVFVLLPSTFIITYIIAITLGHVEVELPYISDTGTHVPESSIFAQLLNFCAFLVGLTIYIRYKQIEQYYRDNLSVESTKIFCRNRIALICGLTSSIGLSMVANFRELELFKIHMVGATMSFGFGAVYCWLQTIMSFRMVPLVNTRLMAQFRLFLATLMSCTFTVSCVCGPWAMKYFHGKDPTNWQPDDGAFGLHLAATVCEWITALALDFFVLSYVRELQ